MPSNISITQPLRTNLGQSLGIASAIQLVWLNWFVGSLNFLHCVIFEKIYSYSNKFFLTSNMNNSVKTLLVLYVNAHDRIVEIFVKFYDVL